MHLKVENMEKMLRRLIDENVEMTVNYGNNIGTIKADSGYVWQVLMNLVVNARDAMPNGGKLAIQTALKHTFNTLGHLHSLPSTVIGGF